MDVPFAPDLPKDVVAHILHHIPVQQRLASCARVNRCWAAAAAASLQAADVQANISDQHGCQHMQDWLRQHAGEVGSMHLACKACKDQPLLQLPCADLTQLQSLSLKRLRLGLCSSDASTGCMQEQFGPPPATSGPGDAPAVTAAAAGASWLPKLHRLKLKHCALPFSNLQLLSRISSLTSLQLHGLQLASTGAPDAHITSAQLSTTIRHILQQLPALADLALGTSAWPIVPVQFPADQPALQRLTLGGGFAAGSLAGLPAGITYLHLQPCGSRCLHVDPGATGLTQLSNLQHLQLTKAAIPAALLSQLTAVQRITLADAWAVANAWAVALGNEEPLRVRTRNNTSRQAQQLLAACKRLQQLQHLEFKYMNDSSVISALGVLTQLTALEVTEQGMPCELGTLHNALQRKLPQLRLLRLVAEPQPSGPPRTYSWDHRDKTSCLDGSGMRNIAKNCPNLEHLALLGVVGPSVLSGCIQTLSRLQTLCVSGAAFKDSVAAAVAQMGSLKAVQWSDSCWLTVAGLQRLTALIGLTRLEVARCPAVAGLPGTAIGRAADSGPELVLQWSNEGSRPDVCCRLQWWCAYLQATCAKSAGSPSSSNPDSKAMTDQHASRQAGSSSASSSSGKGKRRTSNAQVLVSGGSSSSMGSDSRVGSGPCTPSRLSLASTPTGRISDTSTVGSQAACIESPRGRSRVPTGPGWR